VLVVAVAVEWRPGGVEGIVYIIFERFRDRERARVCTCECAPGMATDRLGGDSRIVYNYSEARRGMPRRRTANGDVGLGNIYIYTYREHLSCACRTRVYRK